MPTGWTRPVLDFWFVELGRANWFKGSAALDATIRERFSPAHEAVAARLPPEAMTAPEAALAAILLLDQFPRNMFRDTPRAFATDPQARSVAVNAVDKGLDQALTPYERLFVYLPFEHSEDLSDQEKAVEFIESLCDAEFSRYARAHRDVIARFGRFPHRNAVLGRQSTPEEHAYLAEPGSGF